MGSKVSKSDNLNLVDLCRERKELIKELVKCRYELVSAHVMYLQSLLDVGNALDRFLEEDLVIVTDLTCRNSNQGSHLQFSPSDEGSHLKFPPSDEGSHLQFPSSDSESFVDSLTEYVHGPNASGRGKGDQGEECSNSNSTRISSDVPADSSPRGGRHSQHVSDLYIPVVEMSFVQDDTMTFPDVTGNNHKINAKNFSSKHSSSSRTPMDSPHHGKFWPPANNSPFDLSRISTAPTHNSPEAEFSAWKYYNPFSIDANDLYSYDYWYSHGTDGDDMELRKVRENEGIPDLEYETEQSSVEKRTSKTNELEEAIQVDFGAEDSNFDDSVRGNIEKKSNFQPNIVKNYVSTSCSSFTSLSVEEKIIEEVGPSSEVDEGLADDETDSEQPLKKIKSAFENAFISGKEVCMLLEAGKLPYLPTNAKFKGFALRVLSCFLPFRAISSNHHSYLRLSKSAFKTMKLAQTIGVVSEENLHSRFGNLSSIFEELHMWEKKLLREVEGMEKLCVTYDKKCKMLKTLDDRGSESFKIDTTQASIKRLRPRIKVFISAIDTISAKIHKLRDEDLRSEVNELIHGLSSMWKMILKCHQKQLQAVREAQTSLYIASTNVQSDSGLTATQKLENETMNWATRFNDYFKTQKAFVTLLNKWLSKYLYEEREESSVGIVPLSPFTIGAPPIFITSNDWCNAIRNIAEDKVYNAICGFTYSLRHLRDMQQEKRQQKTEVGEGLNNDGASLRKVFQGQKKQEEESVLLENEAATNCIRIHLDSVFEALELFCLDNLKAYESIRIQNNEESSCQELN